MANKQPIVVFDQNGNMRVTVKNKTVEQAMFEMRDGVDGLEKFCKFFFPTSFKKPFTAYRKDFARRISNTDLPFVWGMASRSFGKTTLIWAEIIRRICFRINRFILYTSSEQMLAERRTENVKSALRNPMLVEYFGRMTPQYEDGMRDVFGAKAWKLCDWQSNESFVIVVPKSDGQTVNGLVEFIGGEQCRPDLILCDDSVDRKRVNDEVYRDEITSWLFGTLFPCVENEIQPNPITHKWGIKRGQRPPWQNMLIDTCKHSAAPIEVAASSPEWFGARYPLYREVSPGRFISLVENITDEQAQARWDSYAAKGKEEQFYKEYCCIPGTANDSKFPAEFFYYKESEACLSTDPDVVKFILVDPAKTKNPRSCPTAMLAVGVNCKRGMVYLRELVHARLAFEEIGSELVKLAKRTNTDILCVEDNGLNDAIKGPLETYTTKMGMFPYWIWLPSRGKYLEVEGERRSIKEARASTALWLYRPFEPTHPNGHVLHEESLKFSALEGQMRSFPELKGGVDALDCLGYVDYVMRELGLVFERHATGEEGTRASSTDAEWEDLLSSGAWRCA